MLLMSRGIKKAGENYLYSKVAGLSRLRLPALQKWAIPKFKSTKSSPATEWVKDWSIP